MEKVLETTKKTATKTTEPFFRSSLESADNLFFKGSGNAVNTIQRQPYDTAKNKAADNENKSAPPAPDLAEPKEKSALRDALTELFKEFEGTHVGDKKFDDIETQKAWDDTKKEEETKKAEYKKLKDEYDIKKAKYDADVAAHRDAGARPIPPIPVAIFTTCIATQGVLLKKAFAAAGLQIQKVGVYDNNLKLKKNARKTATYGYGTLAQQQATELKAWHTATINDPQRPERGDIIILASRGSSVDKAAATVKYIKDSVIAPAQKKTDVAEKAFAAKEKALNDADAALAALQAANASDSSPDMIVATQQVKKANEAFKLAKKAAEDAEASLQKGLASAADAEKKVELARSKVDHTKVFEFSHVGFVESITANSDGTETWMTFDGGQTLDTSEGKQQGAKSNKRTYNPKTNEIAGEASQGTMAAGMGECNQAC